MVILHCIFRRNFANDERFQPNIGVKRFSELKTETEQPTVALTFVQVVVKDTLKLIGDQNKETMELALKSTQALFEKPTALLEKSAQEKEALLEKSSKEKEVRIQEQQAQIEKIIKEKSEITTQYEVLKVQNEAMGKEHSREMLRAHAERNIRGALGNQLQLY